MEQMTLQQILEMAQSAQGSINKIYLHWTAGHYQSKFDDYHINIDEKGNYFVSCDDFTERKNHTYHRNTGAIGIALDCCVNATSQDLGDEPPTQEQIEACAKLMAVLAYALQLPVIKENFLTHGEAADNEDGLEPHEAYGPRTTCERWDLEFLATSESPSFNPDATDGSRGGDVLRGKANWYLDNGIS